MHVGKRIAEPFEIEIIRKSVANGESAVALAEKLNMGERSLSRIMKENGIERPKKMTILESLGTDRRDLLKQLWLRGVPIKEICARVDIKVYNTVKNIAKEMGLPGRDSFHSRDRRSSSRVNSLQKAAKKDGAPIQIAMPTEAQVRALAAAEIANASLREDDVSCALLTVSAVKIEKSDRRDLCRAYDELSGWKCEEPRLDRKNPYCRLHQKWAIRDTGQRTNFDLVC